MSDHVKEKSELWDEVATSLEKIKPYLEADGGDVKIIEITDDLVVRLELLGACGNCAMSEMTMKAGIEEAIMRSVPEIQGVEAINSN